MKLKFGSSTDKALESLTKETRDQAKVNNIYPNHILSLQDKGKVLTICKKTTIFLRKKYGMERLF